VYWSGLLDNQRCEIINVDPKPEFSNIINRAEKCLNTPFFLKLFVQICLTAQNGTNWANISRAPEICELKKW
jgi:hypothetical protein